MSQEIHGDEKLAMRQSLSGDTGDIVRVNANGTSTVEALQEEEAKRQQQYGAVINRVKESRLAEIREKIEDPNFSQVDLGKLIAVEMTAILESMNSILDNVTKSGTQPFDKVATKEVVASLGEQLKGVRELGKQINEMDNLAKRDYINFDGDKFIWILRQWIKVGKNALQKMGWEAFAIQNWENHFRQLLEVEQERIRRDAEKQVWLEEEKEKAKMQQVGN